MRMEIILFNLLILIILIYSHYWLKMRVNRLALLYIYRNKLKNGNKTKKKTK